MKTIIVGGDGFVGRHLAAQLLERQREVVVADTARSPLSHYSAGVTHMFCDITRNGDIAKLPIAPDDVVINLAARMLVPLQKRGRRKAFFWPVNFEGASAVLHATRQAGANQYVQFTTDMVYGKTVQSPQTEDHPRHPLGEYGASKLAIERECERMRGEGMAITLFRPRLIIGPGRLGILVKLFKLIDANLPVPMIGSGQNAYQFVSVFDCATAARLAAEQGCPNGTYNLGSSNPPSVRDLLSDLITAAGSKSILLPTPAPLVKLALEMLDRINMPLMDPEQYLIADEKCVRDTAAIERDLGWRPADSDTAMLRAAYAEYRATREGNIAAAPALTA